MGSPSQLKDLELPVPQFPISYTLQERVSLAHWVLWVDLMADPTAAPSPTFYGVFL